MTGYGPRDPSRTDRSAADRLRTQIHRHCNAWGVQHPTDAQIGAVMHALADYTAITDALRWTGDPDPATCFGRWYHAVGDQYEGRQ